MKDTNLIYDENNFVIDCINPKEVNWPCISAFQKLSESFIEKYKNKVSWYWISKYQKLSEPFIEKHQDKVDLFIISKYKKECEVSLCLNCGFIMLEYEFCQNCKSGNLKTLKMTYGEFQNLPDFPEKEDLVEFLL